MESRSSEHGPAQDGPEKKDALSPSQQPYDPAEDPDADPESMLSKVVRQPDQAEGE